MLLSLSSFSQGNSGGSWQLKLDIDNYFSIREAWVSDGKSVSIVVYDTNEIKQYALSLITLADEWNHFNFPGDFIALSDQAKKEPLPPQDLIFEVRVKRNVERRVTFYFDPSPNALLQLDLYTFEEKLDSSVVWGKFIDAYSWEDKKGENVVVRSELVFDESDSITSYRKYIYLYHFLVEEDQLKLIRKFTDVCSSCPHIPNGGFSLPSIELTDIDRDTVGEINTVYDLYCDGGDTLNYHTKVLLTSYGKKFMLDALVNPCADTQEDRFASFSKSSSFKFYPYLLRYMQQKIGDYYEP